jgi:hypothetical protein
MRHFRQIFLQLTQVRIAVPSAIFFLLFLPHTPARAQDHSMHEMHPGASAAVDEALDPARQAKLLADKRESEFNHHIAGLFVVLAGLFIFAEGNVRERWPWIRFAWPLCFILSGIFVLLWSDTELWPFGSQSWYYQLSHNAEVLQHKIFAVLLLVLGIIEFRRSQGVLKSAWARWMFPLLAMVGSSMLFFHQHKAGMHGPNHMELMRRIQSEHFSFSVAGFGIGLSKGLSETESAWRSFFERLFPALLMVLGALLLVYAE